MAELKGMAQSAEPQNQQHAKQRSSWVPWVVGILVVLVIIASAFVAFWIVKWQGVAQGTSTLTIISIVAGFAIGLLSLFIAFLSWYYSWSSEKRAMYLPRPSEAEQDIYKPKEPRGDDPFEWITIPAGKVTLEDKRTFDKGTKGGTYDISAFAIAKYPVTNAQYQKFVDASNGYCEQSWWDYSDEAKAWRKEHPQSKDTAFAGDGLPRTNKCWYEAIAFCRWISHYTSQIITLPTEQQWQRAAQGDNNWEYPWGSKFDEKQCNSSVKKESTGPTPVTLFSNGVSQYQVMDLSGNVWEWCLTEWSTDSVDLRGSKQRVIRGGSWSNKSKDILRAAYRDKRNPDREQNNLGFRCVQSGQQTRTGA